jgi:hypothetical protein
VATSASRDARDLDLDREVGNHRVHALHLFHHRRDESLPAKAGTDHLEQDEVLPIKTTV